MTQGKKTLVLGAVLLSLIAGGAGVIAALGTPVRIVDDYQPHIGGVFSTVEAVVVVEAVDSLGEMRASPQWSPAPGWSFDVVDVLFVATRSQEEVTWAGEDVELSDVPVPAGRIEAVGERDVDLATAERGGELVVFLSAPDPTIHPELAVPWLVKTAAVDTPQGLSFVALHQDLFDEQWTAYIGLLGDEDAVEAAERRAVRSGDGVLPIPAQARALGADPSQTHLELGVAVAWVAAHRDPGAQGNAMSALVGYPWPEEGSASKG